MASAQSLIADREIPADEKKSVAEAVAFSSIKFAMLLQDAHKPIVFDPAKALSFEGETGPYLQYSYARCASILTRATASSSPDYTLLTTPAEKRLLRLLGSWPVALAAAADQYKPNYVARFALDLAHEFNSYYASTKVMGEPEQDARLALVAAVQTMLKNSLEVLSIKVIEKM